MKAPPAPIVLTAGVGRNKKKSTKKGKGSKGKTAHLQKNNHQAADEEIGASVVTAQDTSLEVQNNSITEAAEINLSNGESNNNVEDPDAVISGGEIDRRRQEMIQEASVKLDDLYSAPPVIDTEVEVTKGKSSEFFWLAFCFFGIMGSFVCYGLLLEYATSGGKHLHELSFLFVTSLLYTLTGSVGRYIRAEKQSTIPPAQFAVLGLTSMGSTFFSVRALRYVIYPIQVLAKSCKPVPVMLMGALMGKKYPPKKYLKVLLIVGGVGLFMGGGDKSKKSDGDEKDASSQMIGVSLLFISLCFDGGTGAYEDKLMSVHSVGPFDLMYNIQMGKTILAGIGLIVLNQVHIFVQMCQEMGFLLVALGLSGAIGQVFIFVTIAKFGALTCSIIGLARKVTTLVASIYFYGHHLNKVQFLGLVICIGAMVNDFFGKKGKKGGHGHGHGGHETSQSTEFKDNAEENQPMLQTVEEKQPDSMLEMGNRSIR